MTEAKPKTRSDDEDQIDPKLADKTNKKPEPGPRVAPVGQTEQRRENESDANRDRDGQRKRAEEGL